ncbi:MAG: hypothetical protein R3B91_18460 [Planctomycetaceae bacterium]
MTSLRSRFTWLVKRVTVLIELLTAGKWTIRHEGFSGAIFRQIRNT